jgi:cytochrome c-type biogenesis protein CcmH/NrfG
LRVNWQHKVIVSSGYLELGMLEDAARILDEIEPADKCRKEVLAAQLDVQLAAKQWEIATLIAASLVKSEPEDPAGWLALAHLVVRTSHLQYAGVVLAKAHKWHPNIAVLLLDLAREAITARCPEEAKVWLQCAAQLPEDVRGSALQNEGLLWNGIEDSL